MPLPPSLKAKLTEKIFAKGVGLMLAHCIAGHHAGLSDEIGSMASLNSRLQGSDTHEIPQEIRAALTASIPCHNAIEAKTSYYFRGRIGKDKMSKTREVQ